METLLYLVVALAMGVLGLSIYAFKLRSKVKELQEELKYAYWIIRRKGKTSTAVPNMSENLDHQIYLLYMEGYPISEIARRVGVHRSTVYRRLKKIMKAKSKVKIPIRT